MARKSSFPKFKSSKGKGRYQDTVYRVPNPTEARKRARYILDYLRVEARDMEPDQQRGFVLGHLRTVCPFTTEELWLHVCEDNGWQVKRPNYVLDGGIDGEVTINGDQILIQSKRIKGAVDPEHVKAFTEVVAAHPTAECGLFIHTGKTTLESRYYLQKANNIVQMLSGTALVNFVLFPL